MLKPVLEKFLSCGEVEVLRISGEEFVLRKITTKQADFLNEYYEYFRYRPLEFLPFLNAIVLEVDKQKLNKFIRNDNGYDEERISMFVYAICIQALNLRPLSLDYTFSNAVIDLLENSTIMNYFIKPLIQFGYKKSEIDEFSNNKIIRLALEELYIRNKADGLIFIAKFLASMDKTVFPLSFNEVENIRTKASELSFPSETMRVEFLKEIEEYLGGGPKDVTKPSQGLKQKTTQEIMEEINKIQNKNKKQPITDFGMLPK